MAVIIHSVIKLDGLPLGVGSPPSVGAGPEEFQRPVRVRPSGPVSTTKPMKQSLPVLGAHGLRSGIVALALLASGAQVVLADAIPYPTPGTPNGTIYTFTAVNTGPITAYFAGSTASYHNELGLLVNGVSSGIYGLENHSSAIGQSLVLGNVTAGDVLTFVLKNNTLGAMAYSDPSMNAGYDLDGSKGHNHVYATPYTATSPLFTGIPVGTFVSFEDQRFPNSDFNYNDEDFVFTNVRARQNSVPDAASSLGLLSMSLTGLGLVSRRLRK